MAKKIKQIHQPDSTRVAKKPINPNPQLTPKAKKALQQKKADDYWAGQKKKTAAKKAIVMAGVDKMIAENKKKRKR